MDPRLEHQLNVTRRQFFGRSAMGIGGAALAGLLGNERMFAASPSKTALPEAATRYGGLDGLPHFAPKAKHVIYLLQNGAPSHVDTFDFKPLLRDNFGMEIPESVHKNQRLSTMTNKQTAKPILPPQPAFHQHGRSGAWVCDLLPHTGSIADELCFVKSMHTTQINHAPAILFFLTGGEMPGRPSMGAWLAYGLGSETQDLPAFVAMTSRDKDASCGQLFYDFYWSSGFLPSQHQGVQFRGSGEPVLYVSNPDGVSPAVRRGLLDDLARLNQLQYQQFGDPEIPTRISQYEMAFRMQTSVPDLTDFSQEPQHVLDMYGPDVHRPGTYAYNCLMARRLVERGVRHVQMFHAGWDQHANLTYHFEVQCRDTDQPTAALVKDLKQRGLLEDTLVIWAGEFGRTPFCQGDLEDRDNWGRDHHPYGFTIWMAGGGIKPGITYGATDEFGYNAVENPVHVHDFQATLLHLLGIDHERLNFKFQGRRFRLTDVHGRVVRDLLA